MARTLVIGPSWVGDMVMAQALFKRIARLDSGGEVHVVSPGWSQSLTERMPEVTRAYVLDVPHGSFGFARRRDLGRALAPMGFDRAFVLPRSWKSALVPFFAGAGRRTGYRGEMRYGLLNDIVPRNAVPVEGGAKPRTVDEFVALADPSEPCMRPEEMPRLRRDPDSEAATAGAFAVAAADGAVTLCPGAEAGPVKQWPIKRYAALARALGEAGRPVWIIGSQRDRHDCDQIAEAAGRHARVFAGETSLVQAIDILEMSAAVVSNDSGLMHVAAALRKPVVALYGPTSEKVNPPLSDTARVLAHRPEGRTAGRGSMDAIEPDQVLDALRTLEAELGC